MKEQSTTHKAAGLGNREKLKAETLKAEIQNGSVPQLTGEEKFLESVMEFTRGLKRSRDRDIANAAHEWEPIFNFRIRMTMQERKRRAKARALRLHITAKPTKGTPTSAPSGVHIQVSVSPNQD